MQQHKFIKFVSLKSDECIGFLCGDHYRQCMPDAGKQRVISAMCFGCGQSVSFDAGLFGWRRWLLPRRAFTTSRRTGSIWSLRAGWDGNTTYSPPES